jgi:hypothetical protein
MENNVNSFVFDDSTFEEKKVDETELSQEELEASIEKETKELETTTTETVEDNPFQILTDLLVENSIVDTELLEKGDYSDSAEGILSLINDTVDKKYQEFINEKFSDEKYKTVLDILDNGGDLSDIAKIYDQVDYSAIDLTIEGNDEMLVRDFYERSNLSEKKIEALIKNAKDDGSWEEEVNMAHSALVNMQIAEAKALQESLAYNNEQAQLDAEQALEDFKKLVFSKDEIAGFKLDEKGKQKFFDYSTKPVNKQGQTQMELDYANVDKQLENAYMSFINYNKKDLETKANSEASAKLAKSITSLKDKTSKQGSNKETDSILDDVLFFGS